MVQPVYIIDPPTDAQWLEFFFIAPAIAGWLYAAAKIWDDGSSVHPVLRIIGIAALALAFGFVRFRMARLAYAFTVIVAGSALIIIFAPDLLWKGFGEVVFLVIWCLIVVHFERNKGDWDDEVAAT